MADKYRTKNGKLKSKYVIWYGMIARCECSSNSIFKHYGGRGITICEKWKTYDGFWSDMKSEYKKGLTLERIDNNGNYCKSNCRWATRMEQANNRRSNRFIIWNNIKKTIMEWSRVTGVNRRTITQRLNAGWGVDEIFTPAGKAGYHHR